MFFKYMYTNENTHTHTHKTKNLKNNTQRLAGFFSHIKKFHTFYIKFVNMIFVIMKQIKEML